MERGEVVKDDDIDECINQHGLTVEISEIIKGNMLIQKLSNGKEIYLVSSKQTKDLLQDQNKMFLILKDESLLSRNQLSSKDKRNLHTQIRDIDIEIHISDEEFLSFCCDFFNLAQDLKNDNCYVVDFSFDPNKFSSLSISLYQENCLVPIDISLYRYKNNNPDFNLNTNTLCDSFVGNNSNSRSNNINYYQKSILKNMLHILKKVIRDDVQDELVDHLKSSFEILFSKKNSKPAKNYQELKPRIQAIPILHHQGAVLRERLKFQINSRKYG